MRNLYEHDNFVGFPMLIFKVTIQIQVSVFPDAFTSEWLIYIKWDKYMKICQICVQWQI